jgi:hypothetical protein
MVMLAHGVHTYQDPKAKEIISLIVKNLRKLLVLYGESIDLLTITTSLEGLCFDSHPNLTKKNQKLDLT